MRSGRTPEEYRDFFASVLADLDERPRALTVEFLADDLVIDLAGGEVVFSMPGRKDVRGNFRRRWLPEHPVPLHLKGTRPHVLKLLPTSGNRVRFRFG